jgi:hypothetical protein
MMSGVPNGNYNAVAEMFPRHDGSTALYVNFDGWSAKHVSAFTTTTPDDGDPLTDDRELEIQAILYQVSEIFSPFDVQVRRITGDAARALSKGATTVFVGDSWDYGLGSNNHTGGITPASYVDFPGGYHSDAHAPNSNPYDLALVDPIDHNSALSWNYEEIAQAIAHEAGHTFGLGHVVSPDSGAVADIMSYDASNKRFADQFLRLTSRNGDGYDGYVPEWHGQDMFQQNSFQFLKTVLGERPADDFTNVTFVDRDNVEYFTNPREFRMNKAGVTQASLDGVIDRYGDYDVFRYKAVTDEVVTFQVQTGAFLGLRSPQVLAFTNFSARHLSFVETGAGTAQIILHLRAGKEVEFVVGGHNGDSVGTYKLSFSAKPELKVNNLPPLGSILDANYISGAIRPAGQGALTGAVLTTSSYGFVSSAGALAQAPHTTQTAVGNMENARVDAAFAGRATPAAPDKLVWRFSVIALDQLFEKLGEGVRG